ncbi:MAG: M4 family metallopeptidase [Bacteroidia bacterium]|nr:M4 family metallopeptidase [Bacteroidia bacterium]
MFRVLTITIVFCSFNLIAQNQNFEVKFNNPKTGYPGLITFNESSKSTPSLESPALWFRENLNANQDFTLVFHQSNTDQLGFKHFRYYQFYKGYKIEGAEVIIHQKNNITTSINGRYFPNLSMDAKVSITSQLAMNNAMNLYAGSTFMWEIPKEEQLLKLKTGNPNATYKPVPHLIIYSTNDTGRNEDFKLVYEIDLYVAAPQHTRQLIYIDAVSGQLVDHYEQICSIDKVGIAHTKYSGIKSIQCDSIGTDSFILMDNSRGKGIYTIDARVISVDDSSRNFLDTDNVWNNVNQYQDEVATDVHWGSALTYDYYKSTFNRDSYDDSGSMILSRVHIGENYNNAFWDGYSANYGDGDNIKYTPLVSLDICSHELTHGVTGNTAKLRYRNESGALNESFSDIFAKAVEQYLDSINFTWYIADKIVIGSTKAFRNLSNPNEFSHPTYYFGQYFYSGANDNGGVHTNSGVQNYWFYLLCNGGMGQREDGKLFFVEPIGYRKAAAIAYSNLSSYLTRFSEYIDACYLSLDAAKALYGENSFEYKQVENAWFAVGLLEHVDITAQSNPQNTWNIFPNPGNLQIQLINPESFTTESLEILDVSGKQLLNINYTSGDSIDVSALCSGLYFIKIGSSTLKWIKQ